MFVYKKSLMPSFSFCSFNLHDCLWLVQIAIKSTFFDYKTNRINRITPQWEHALQISYFPHTVWHAWLIRVEVASSWPDHVPTMLAAKTSELSLLVKSHFLWRIGRFQQCYSDFLLQCAEDIEADHTDSGIVIDCTDRNRETPHLDDCWGELTTTTTCMVRSSADVGTLVRLSECAEQWGSMV